MLPSCNHCGLPHGGFPLVSRRVHRKQILLRGRLRNLYRVTDQEPAPPVHEWVAVLPPQRCPVETVGKYTDGPAISLQSSAHRGLVYASRPSRYDCDVRRGSK